MTTVVITQPMFFPWPGMLEQVRLADVVVYYDDVQFSKGSFSNRVQVKTASGSKWLSVPLVHAPLGTHLRAVLTQPAPLWKAAHLALLEQAYAAAPHRREMLDVVECVYGHDHRSLADLSIASMDALAEYFELASPRRFLRSSGLEVAGSGSQRVLDIVRAFGGSTYVTGHGARNYLEHEAFEANGVVVEYLDYGLQAYPQLHGDFTPFVSSLDLIANRGREGRAHLRSPAIPWREFLARRS
jgi:hypothetical protein